MVYEHKGNVRLATGDSLKKKYWRGDNRLNNLIDPMIKDEDKDKLEKILDNCLLKLKGILNDYKENRQTAYDIDVCLCKLKVIITEFSTKMELLLPDRTLHKVIDCIIEYQSNVDYGIEVNRKLYWYFLYITENYKIRLFINLVNTKPSDRPSRSADRRYRWQNTDKANTLA